MRHIYGWIAGASALAVAGVLSVQTGLVGGSRGEAPPDPAASQPVATVAAPTLAPPVSEPEPPAEAAASAAGLEDRIASLETMLADREAAVAGLGETMAARDASIAEMTAALADRDAELTALRDELAGLRIEPPTCASVSPSTSSSPR